VGTEQRKKADESLVLALACGATVETAARQCQLSIRTIYRRLKEAEFCARVREARADMMQRSAGMLTAAAGESVRTLLSLQKDSMPPPVRLGVAQAVLEIGIKVRELVDLETRIAAAGLFGHEPDFPTALAECRVAIERSSVGPPWVPPDDFMPLAKDKGIYEAVRRHDWRARHFPAVRAALDWLDEMRHRVIEGIPPVSEDKFGVGRVAGGQRRTPGRAGRSEPAGAVGHGGDRLVGAPGVCAFVDGAVRPPGRAAGAGQRAVRRDDPPTAFHVPSGGVMIEEVGRAAVGTVAEGGSWRRLTRRLAEARCCRMTQWRSRERSWRVSLCLGTSTRLTRTTWVGCAGCTSSSSHSRPSTSSGCGFSASWTRAPIQVSYSCPRRTTRSSPRWTR
jgi:hypothetical protein